MRYCRALLARRRGAKDSPEDLAAARRDRPLVVHHNGVYKVRPRTDRPTRTPAGRLINRRRMYRRRFRAANKIKYSYSKQYNAMPNVHESVTGRATIGRQMWLSSAQLLAVKKGRRFMRRPFCSASVPVAGVSPDRVIGIREVV